MPEKYKRSSAGSRGTTRPLSSARAQGETAKKMARGRARRRRAAHGRARLFVGTKHTTRAALRADARRGHHGGGRLADDRAGDAPRGRAHACGGGGDGRGRAHSPDRAAVSCRFSCRRRCREGGGPKTAQAEDAQLRRFLPVPEARFESNPQRHGLEEDGRPAQLELFATG